MSGHVIEDPVILISITDKFESFFSTCKNYTATTTHRENEILDGEWPRFLEILAPTGLARELLYIVRASLSFVLHPSYKTFYHTFHHALLI